MASAPAPAFLGQMDCFNPQDDTITAYLERFTLYVTVNGIAENKLRPTLLLVLGKDHYSHIRGLLSQEKPEDK